MHAATPVQYYNILTLYIWDALSLAISAYSEQCAFHGLSKSRVQASPHANILLICQGNEMHTARALMSGPIWWLRPYAAARRLIQAADSPCTEVIRCTWNTMTEHARPEGGGIKR